jgi:hypothetical protein
MSSWCPYKTKKQQPLPKPFLTNCFAALVLHWTLSLTKAKNFVQKFQMICSKGLAPLTLKLCGTTLSATTKQKLPARQSQNIWQAFVTTPH